MRKLAVLLALAFLPACKDATGSNFAEIAGTYTMQSVNGGTLPFFMGLSQGDSVHITGGSIVLRADRRFSDNADFRIKAGGQSTTDSDLLEGRFTVGSGVVSFTSDDGQRYTASVNGSTLSMQRGAFLVVYRK